jgi:peptidase E
MRQIIAMGGGGFSMEPENLLFDKYILAQIKTYPRYVLFQPLAKTNQIILKDFIKHLSFFLANLLTYLYLSQNLKT